MIKWLCQIFVKRRHRVIRCTPTRSLAVETTPTVILNVRDIRVAYVEARIIRDSGNA